MKHLPLLLALTAFVSAVTPAHGAEDTVPSDNPAPPTPDNSVLQVPLDPGLPQLLENHRWALLVATDSDNRRIEVLFPPTGRPYTFAFAGAMLNVQGGCNNLGGGYQIDTQGQLLTDRVRSTMMACAPELMQADTALAALLAQPMRMAITPGVTPRLQLRTAANETLELEGQATPESLYGPGTLLFLEVDAQQLPCRNPRNGQTTCLQVRELYFDEQGLRSGPPGPWQPFYDNIDGYSHTPGQRNVVRVKRFERGAGPKDAAPAIYVLDLIIESETLPQ